MRVVTCLVHLLSCSSIVVTASQYFPNNNVFGIRRVGDERSMKPISEIPISNSMLLLNSIRGGESDIDSDTDVTDDDSADDEERYSRQLYTLGARAHSLVRSSTILVDGPARSGLVYESVKNLALSGVGKIILLTNEGQASQGELEEHYFNQEMDDLGNVYRRGAKVECFPDDEEVDDTELLMEYIRRLNPSVKVEKMQRIKYLSEIGTGGEIHDIVGSNPVLLCVDRPLSTQRILNKSCRSVSTCTERKMGTIPFIAIETAGVYGKAFSDFGDEFCIEDEDGETPKSTLLDNADLEEGHAKGECTLHCVEGERHDVSKGDTIKFQWQNGEGDDLDEVDCIVTYVQNPTRFRVKFHDRNGEIIQGELLEQLSSTINNGANSFARVKIPKPMSFLSLEDALAAQHDATKEIFAASDLDKSFDPTRRKAVMSSFVALEAVVQKNNALPCREEADNFVKEVNALGTEDSKRFDSITSSFAQCAKAKFTPLQCIYGALGAQESLKAASGLYNPIKQFLLYDCDEILTGIKHKAEDDVSNISGMKYIIGKKLTKRLCSQKVFVVGSGAIGCEILKNLAAMDVGTGTRKKKGGSIILTDMDTIEKSNLSRQLLFRDADVGKCKSTAAQEAVHRLNPNVKLDSHTSKVGDDVKGTFFDDKFWSSGVDVVLNALDNMEARLFIDSQCVANQKALVDAGTLGAKGNVQVVVPRQSESYASSSDPPDPTIPVCTLKHFPYEISHTIQWGRDLFDGLYNRRPGQVNEHKESLSNTNASQFAKSLFDKLGEDAAMDTADDLLEDCLNFDSTDDENKTKIKDASIKWATKLAKTLFYDSIMDLLEQHPLDSLDDDDKPFWSGTRKAPTPLTYSENEITAESNSNIIDFVRYAARLRIETYYPASLLMKDMASKVTPEEVKTALLEQSKPESITSNEDSFQKRITDKVQTAKAACKKITKDLNIASFEKDDDSNGHVAFVTAASNLRAIAYGIAPVDAMETRRVAGRIVPAMITTTALVSALSCIEFVKLTQGAQLHQHRNAFVNLALPFFAFTSPLPAEEVAGLHGTSHTIWDKLLIKEEEKHHLKGGITMRRFLRKIKKKSEDGEIEVSNISYGPFMLYANFLHEDDDDVLDAPVLQLVLDAITSGDIEDDDFGEDNDEVTYTEEQLAEIKALEKEAFTDFSVLVEDVDTGEEAELPPVRLQWWNRER